MITRPALAAQKVYTDLFIQNPNDLDIEGIVNLNGSFYQEKSMADADGRIIFKGNNTIITINADIAYAPKKRFVMAHELGHLLLHKNVVPVFNCTEAAFMQWYEQSSFETQANEFAAELLMPQNLFIEQARKIKKFDFNTILTLAKYFQTSVTSTIIKFISASTYPMAVVYSTNGKINWQAFTNDFIFKRFIKKKGEIIPKDTVAHDILNGKAKPQEKEPILANYWFTVFDSQRDIYLYEECFPVPSQNGLISLLWVCNDY